MLDTNTDGLMHYARFAVAVVSLQSINTLLVAVRLESIGLTESALQESLLFEKCTCFVCTMASNHAECSMLLHYLQMIMTAPSKDCLLPNTAV